MKVSVIIMTVFILLAQQAAAKAETYCGDGILTRLNDRGQVEWCDDGNTADGDGCNSLCQIEGSSRGWLGCGGTGIHVCIEKVPNTYFSLHPQCVPNYDCRGQYSSCENKYCPEPDVVCGSSAVSGQDDLCGQAVVADSSPVKNVKMGQRFSLSASQKAVITDHGNMEISLDSISGGTCKEKAAECSKKRIELSVSSASGIAASSGSFLLAEGSKASVYGATLKVWSVSASDAMRGWRDLS